MKTPFDTANRRRMWDEILHELAFCLWVSGGAIGWAMLIAEGLRLFLGYGGTP